MEREFTDYAQKRIMILDYKWSTKTSLKIKGFEPYEKFIKTLWNATEPVLSVFCVGIALS